ncbi:glycosyltransferase family 2 protein [Methylovulum miyakonense]|uniref:glycosyltransferase family 2 protein n=1 Tax=Methylovulum miyakonense TaxID=645578 RepID=UPI00039CD076|nr:glycosyltransferase family 2 protein [Methylovulum miyakonense]
MLTAIILTFNEELHIERCIRSVIDLAKNVIVIDSFSTDKTVEIAESLGAYVVQRKFINQAEQFQWGLDNLEIQTEWIIKLDADEYIESDLNTEIANRLVLLNSEIQGVYLKRKIFFHQKWIRFGGIYPQYFLRIWKTGKGRVEHRWMDEHTVLDSGAKSIIFQGSFVDDNRKGITFWINKVNSYASREMLELLNLKYSLYDKDDSIKNFDDPQAKKNRILKEILYSRLPIGVRSFGYFVYRYILCLGFLDGYKGLIFHLFQAFFYRLLVDVKLLEIEMETKGDREYMKAYIKKYHGIEL